MPHWCATIRVVRISRLRQYTLHYNGPTLYRLLVTACQENGRCQSQLQDVGPLDMLQLLKGLFPWHAYGCKPADMTSSTGTSNEVAARVCRRSFGLWLASTNSMQDRPELGTHRRTLGTIRISLGLRATRPSAKLASQTMR